MQPATIVCDAPKLEGGICGQAALVRGIQYEFDNLMYRGGGGAFQQILKETRYDIECPACGRRTQVEKATA